MEGPGMAGQLGLFLSSHGRVASARAVWCRVCIAWQVCRLSSAYVYLSYGDELLRGMDSCLVVVCSGRGSRVSGVCMYVGGCTCVWCISTLLGGVCIYASV